MLRNDRPIVLCLIVCLALTISCAGIEAPRDLPEAERKPGANELLAYPGDGLAAPVNPPGFTWTPADGAESYKLYLFRGESERAWKVSGPHRSTVAVFPKKYPKGGFRWFVAYVDGNGVEFGRSKERSFSIGAEAAVLPMPEIADLKKQVAGVRPRLFIAGERLDEIRRAIDSGRCEWWPAFSANLEIALNTEPYDEPTGYVDGVWTAPEWRRIFTPAKHGGLHMVKLAFAWHLTGEQKYLDAAKGWMLKLASWDSRGITSHKVPQPDGTGGNDEASMALLERFAIAWDWIGQELDPDERKAVLATIRERGNQVLIGQEEMDFISQPTISNHEGRVLAFLGDAGLSLLGDLPDAEKWLEHVLRCYIASYPAWGGDDGGWAQGLSYWAGYVFRLSTFAQALRQATDVDIFKRPFYRNTGYLPVLFHPPYAERGAFGDAGERGPNITEKLLVGYLARVFNDPVLQWHADNIKASPPTEPPFPLYEWSMEDFFAVLRTWPETIAPKPPSELDGSRFLSNKGWVAMHSALGDSANDVWVLFKSSRFGSHSHSHADQNSFQMNAYGRALTIDTGYYPWYGSPHDELWTRQTRAHNCVLVNGRGQPIHVWDAGGEITHYERKGPLTLTQGEAGGAYNLPQPDYVLKMWKEHLKEPVPSMEPSVKTFKRTLAFVGKKERPWLLVHDYLAADSPTRFDWLLHSIEKMRYHDASGNIRIGHDGVNLVVRLIATEPIKFSQTDKFTLPPEDRAAGAPNQWHLTAQTRSKSREIKFLAALVPYRDGEREPVIEMNRKGDNIAFTVGDDIVSVWWGEGETGPVEILGSLESGRFVIRSTGVDGVTTLTAK